MLVTIALSPAHNLYCKGAHQNSAKGGVLYTHYLQQAPELVLAGKAVVIEGSTGSKTVNSSLCMVSMPTPQDLHAEAAIEGIQSGRYSPLLQGMVAPWVVLYPGGVTDGKQHQQHQTTTQCVSKVRGRTGRQATRQSASGRCVLQRPDTHEGLCLHQKMMDSVLLGVVRRHYC